MKVAFTTSGDTLDSPLDSRFGRASKFIIYDMDNASFNVINNEQNLNAAQGAGIQSAQNVSQTGAKALVTGHCGPKAFRVLSAAGVGVFNTNALTVSAALEEFRAGKLKASNSSDVEGHWA